MTLSNKAKKANSYSSTAFVVLMRPTAAVLECFKRLLKKRFSKDAYYCHSFDLAFQKLRGNLFGFLLIGNLIGFQLLKSFLFVSSSRITMSLGTKFNRKLSRSVKLSCCLLFYRRFKQLSLVKIKVNCFRLCSGLVKAESIERNTLITEEMKFLVSLLCVSCDKLMRILF